MVINPKAKALKLTNRQQIIDAYTNAHKAQPSKKCIKLLIDEFNKAYGYELIQLSSFNSCADCRLTIKNFWKYIISEWKKQ